MAFIEMCARERKRARDRSYVCVEFSGTWGEETHCVQEYVGLAYTAESKREGV